MFNHIFCLFGQVLDHQVGLKNMFIFLSLFWRHTWISVWFAAFLRLLHVCQIMQKREASFRLEVQSKKWSTKKKRIFSPSVSVHFPSHSGWCISPRQAVPFPWRRCYLGHTSMVAGEGENGEGANTCNMATPLVSKKIVSSSSVAWNLRGAIIVYNHNYSLIMFHFARKLATMNSPNIFSLYITLKGKNSHIYIYIIFFGTLQQCINARGCINRFLKTRWKWVKRRPGSVQWRERYKEGKKNVEKGWEVYVVWSWVPEIVRAKITKKGVINFGHVLLQSWIRIVFR